MSEEVLDALDRTMDFLREHGWEVKGFALAKGDDLVILRPDGVLEYSGDEPCPPEVLAVLKRGTPQ